MEDKKEVKDLIKVRKSIFSIIKEMLKEKLIPKKDTSFNTNPPYITTVDAAIICVISWYLALTGLIESINPTKISKKLPINIDNIIVLDLANNIYPNINDKNMATPPNLGIGFLWIFLGELG